MTDYVCAIVTTGPTVSSSPGPCCPFDRPPQVKQTQADSTPLMRLLPRADEDPSCVVTEASMDPPSCWPCRPRAASGSRLSHSYVQDSSDLVCPGTSCLSRVFSAPSAQSTSGTDTELAHLGMETLEPSTTRYLNDYCRLWTLYTTLWCLSGTIVSLEICTIPVSTSPYSSARTSWWFALPSS